MLAPKISLMMLLALKALLWLKIRNRLKTLQITLNQIITVDYSNKSPSRDLEFTFQNFSVSSWHRLDNRFGAQHFQSTLALLLFIVEHKVKENYIGIR